MNFDMSNVPPLLRQFIQQGQNSFSQEAQPQTAPMRSTSGMNAYEINAKSDIEYIPPDTTGRLVFLYCAPEKRVYIGRYNHVRKEMDYEAFLSEGDANLFKKSDSAEEMSRLMDALTLFAGKIDTMHSDIQELKAKKPGRKKSTTPDAEPEVAE